MDCKETQALLIDYLDRGLGAEASAGVRAHLAGCEQCRKEVEEMREMLLVMTDQELRQPGPGLRENFQLMLQSELNMEAADDLLRKRGDAKDGHAGAKRGIGWMVAAACVLLVGGFWTGTMVGVRKGAGTTEQLTAMHKEIKDMKEVLLYSLIDDESASQRIKAVSYAEAIPNPDQKVIDVLVGTLNHDKNVNVRLAALYSLATFADRSVVKDSLVASLPKQTEPLIQVMLINLLAAKKDSRAIGPIKDILYNKNTAPVVLDAARKTLKTL
ncbi:MAG TPA: zf-HC2 domain-containing protein [Puia sp.]|jgi:hypothetical protein|nr:zf-HC2 domain-containing protein [Puia sp.]